MNLSDASFSEVEILLVEDNPRDAELAMRALQKNHLANRVVWLKDGAEALAYLFGRAHRGPTPRRRHGSSCWTSSCRRWTATKYSPA